MICVGLLVAVTRLRREKRLDKLPIAGSLVVAYCIWASAYILATSLGENGGREVLSSTTSSVYISVTQMLIPLGLFALPFMFLFFESFLSLLKVRSSHELAPLAAITWWVAVIICAIHGEWF